MHISDKFYYAKIFDLSCKMKKIRTALIEAEYMISDRVMYLNLVCLSQSALKFSFTGKLLSHSIRWKRKNYLYILLRSWIKSRNLINKEKCSYFITFNIYFILIVLNHGPVNILLS